MAKNNGFSPGEIVIEIATPKNSQYVFWRFGTLRGRWEDSNTGLSFSPDSPYRHLPRSIPGICVALDQKFGICRAVDPLGFDENKELMAKVAACSLKDQGHVGPWKEQRATGLTESDIKTVLWRMYVAVDKGKAKIVKGELPKPEDILAMPGELEARTGALRIVQCEPDSDQPMTAYATPRELNALKSRLVAHAAGRL